MANLISHESKDVFNTNDALTDTSAELGGTFHTLGNGILVVASGSNSFSYARDVNGDGDALDFGEVPLFAKGL